MAERLAELNKGDTEVVRDWNDITASVTSSSGYTCPHNMVCFVKGNLVNAGVYFINPSINGNNDTCSFSGQSNAGYAIMHYFYARKSDVLKELSKSNLNNVAYYAIQAD